LLSWISEFLGAIFRPIIREELAEIKAYVREQAIELYNARKAETSGLSPINFAGMETDSA
jgi:hypothetical protein